VQSFRIYFLKFLFLFLVELCNWVLLLLENEEFFALWFMIYLVDSFGNLVWGKT
jgi:hypothetical protein